jgi:hypothetical protein
MLIPNTLSPTMISPTKINITTLRAPDILMNDEGYHQSPSIHDAIQAESDRTNNKQNNKNLLNLLVQAAVSFSQSSPITNKSNITTTRTTTTDVTSYYT